MYQTKNDLPAHTRANVVEMTLNLDRAALVIIAPQIDCLSPTGVTWDAFGASITKALLYERPRCNGR